VNINVQDDYMKDQVQAELMQIGVDLQKIIFHLNPTNDAWCRDHGPAFPGKFKSKSHTNDCELGIQCLGR